MKVRKTPLKTPDRRDCDCLRKTFLCAFKRICGYNFGVDRQDAQASEMKSQDLNEASYAGHKKEEQWIPIKNHAAGGRWVLECL